MTKLKWLRGFTSVDLSGNSIDDACAVHLANLVALRQLRRLDLRRNDIGPSAGAALIEALPRCKGLQVRASLLGEAGKTGGAGGGERRGEEGKGGERRGEWGRGGRRG